MYECFIIHKMFIIIISIARKAKIAVAAVVMAFNCKVQTREAI